MGLEVYGVSQSVQWDNIVKSFADYDTYWLSGYVKAFQLHGDGTPLLFYYNDGATRGISVAMKRDVSSDPHFANLLPANQYFDMATPYGYGGWIIEGNNQDELFSEYEKWCVRNGIISEFVRFHPVVENQKCGTTLYDVMPLGQTIAMDITSPEVIWANLTSKNRNMIRKAQKNGVKVYSARNPEIFRRFKAIYDGTMDKDHAEEYYYFAEDFYTSVLEELPYNVQVFYAQYEGKIIAASIMIFANGKMNYHLSGSLREYSNLAPTNLILYEAAVWGCANGYRTLYLGGGVGSGEDSLFKFKKAFYRKDDLKRFYIGKKIYIPDRYDELVGMREEIDSGFFPKYRA